MSVSTIFWLFLMLVAIAPMIRQRMLEAARLRLLQKLETKRKSRVIALIHRQETMALLGFPIFRYIDIQDSEEVIRAIRMTDKDIPIDLILHTPGGLVLAAEQIAHALKNYPAKVTVFVPHYAMSGGTLLALAADEIVMDPNAVLGSVDPQVGEYPAVSLLKVVEEKNTNRIEDRTLILADVARKAKDQVQECVTKLAEKHMPAEEANKLARAFTEGRWTHDYPIVYEEAKQLGLPVSLEMPQEVYQLMNLYPQPVRRQSMVQYVPTPYGDRSHPKRRGTKW
jgi:ClpP class serine protease